MNGIVGPNGQPVQKQIRIDGDQALFVSMKMIEAQVHLLNGLFKLPPPIIADNLIRLVATIVAPAQPPEARQMLLEQITFLLRSEVNRLTQEFDFQFNIANDPLTKS